MQEKWTPVLFKPELTNDEYRYRIQSEPVLMLYSYGDCAVGIVYRYCDEDGFDGDYVWVTCDSTEWNVTASVVGWMPLPKVRTI